MKTLLLCWECGAVVGCEIPTADGKGMLQKRCNYPCMELLKAKKDCLMTKKSRTINMRCELCADL
jgi:hypothetical protein